MKRNENYRADLLADLRNDPVYAAAYLSAAKADSNEAFLVAVRDVVEARMGVQKVAKKTKLNREHLYRVLSPKGNPRIETLDSVLDVLGFEARFFPKAATPTRTPSGGATEVTPIPIEVVASEVINKREASTPAYSSTLISGTGIDGFVITWAGSPTQQAKDYNEETLTRLLIYQQEQSERVNVYGR